MNLGNKLAVGEVVDHGDIEPQLPEIPETDVHAEAPEPVPAHAES
jgi:hypothetical protein